MLWGKMPQAGRWEGKSVADELAGTVPAAGATSAGNQAVFVTGDNLGSINTGVIINIAGDGFEKNREIARTTLAAGARAPFHAPLR